MVEFFNKRDQRSDIPVPHPCTRIVLFELFNQPPGIINADVKLIAGSPQKCARKFTQFAAASHHMRRNKLIVHPPDLLVKLDVRSATQAAPLRVLVKNSADEE